MLSEHLSPQKDWHNAESSSPLGGTIGGRLQTAAAWKRKPGCRGASVEASAAWVRPHLTRFAGLSSPSGLTPPGEGFASSSRRFRRRLAATGGGTAAGRRLLTCPPSRLRRYGVIQRACFLGVWLNPAVALAEADRSKVLARQLVPSTRLAPLADLLRVGRRCLVCQPTGLHHTRSTGSEGGAVER